MLNHCFRLFFVFALCASTLWGHAHGVKVRDLEKLLLNKPTKDGLVQLKELTPWLLDADLKLEVSSWLKTKQDEVERTADEYKAVLVDDLHRKLLRFIKSYDAKRKWAHFDLELGLAYDSDVALTRDGEATPSGHSSVRHDVVFNAAYEGRWLPWGKASLDFSFADSSYEREVVDAYGSTLFGVQYSHKFKFFRPGFYKESKASLAFDYVFGDGNGDHPVFYTSVRPSFQLVGHKGLSSFKPDALTLEAEFRSYGSLFETGVLGESRDVTGVKLESLWEHSYVYKGRKFDQDFVLFVRNYEADAAEMKYSTIAFDYRNEFEVSDFTIIPNATLQKNFSQEYNSTDRDDLIIRVGVDTAANIYKKNVKIILAFDWEDRQSDHSSFDYNHEIFYLGFQCHW